MKRRIERLEDRMGKGVENIACGLCPIDMSEEECREAFRDQLHAEFGGENYELNVGRVANAERPELIFAMTTEDLAEVFRHTSRSGWRVGMGKNPNLDNKG